MARHDETTKRRRINVKKHDIKRQWTEKIKAAIEEARQRPRSGRVETEKGLPVRPENEWERRMKQRKGGRRLSSQASEAALDGGRGQGRRSPKVLADEPDGPNKEYWTSDLHHSRT